MHERFGPNSLTMLSNKSGRLGLFFRDRRYFTAIVLFSSVTLIVDLAAAPDVPWTEQAMSRGLARMSVDGLWAGNFPLVTDSIQASLGLSVTLHHKLRRTSFNQLRSVWTLSGLQTFVVPHARNALLWQSPSGIPILFSLKGEQDKLSTAGTPSSVHWTLLSTEANQYEVRAENGLSYTYKLGALTRIIHPTLGAFTITAEGGMIQCVRREEDGAAILSASYDEEGNLTRLKNANMDATLCWGRDGELSSLSRNGKLEAEFSYKNALISLVLESGHPSLVLDWKENKDYSKPGSKWPAPASLRSDGQYDYDYRVTLDGCHVAVVNRADGSRTETRISPVRHYVEQTTNDGQVHAAHFERHQDRLVFSDVSH